jgi:hydrogen peroxide-dependent heme synthase
MAEVPGTLEGWYALHDFRRIDWAAFKQLTKAEQEEALEEFAAFVREVEGAEAGSSAIYSVVGHKADMMMIHLRPTVEQLNKLERRFAATRLADFTSQPYSYLSVTELSLYEAAARGGGDDPEEMRKNPFVQKRLYPAIPDYPYACFYPMNKKRGEVENWYTLGMEERRVMMGQHAKSGRKYADTITQMITGSTGLDDWEWGVTLFAVDTLPIKKIVYEMRFDEVSAKYGEFGAFEVGIRVKADKVSEFFSL